MKVTSVGLRAALVGQLNESDLVYFELGANRTQLAGCDLVWMPGLTALSAACVVQRVRPSSILSDPPAWIRAFEAAVGTKGARARVYLQEPLPHLEKALSVAGYRPRAEIGFLSRADRRPASPTVRLCPIVTEAQWAVKAQIHRESDAGPDGHTNSADLWIELERTKCETGRMTPYLIEHADSVCGTVATIDLDEILRLKNIVIRPRSRRRGFGLAAVYALWQMAIDRRKTALGVFALEDSAGEAMYSLAGLEAVSRQVEWLKYLNGGSK